METYFISDTHFGHSNILKFTDGCKPLRPFASAEEMDEVLVKNWNAVVRPKDIVYHLGDVVINRRCLPTVGRLNGIKHLVMGNHDTFRATEYLEYFKELHAVKVFEKHRFVCTHVPLHQSSLERWGVNVHGHLHANSMGLTSYVCVSVEQIDYTPIALPALLKRIRREI